MPNIVTKTEPTDEGEMLWCVHYKSSFYDDDPRMPGTVPVNARIFVLAKGRENAIAKAEPAIAESRKESDENADQEIEASIVTIENLIPARDSSNDGRLGWVSIQDLKPIELYHDDDKKRYRLGVCLIPV